MAGIDVSKLSKENKEWYLRSQRRELAAQRKAEGREYMSIIAQDIGKIVQPKSTLPNKLIMLEIS